MKTRPPERERLRASLLAAEVQAPTFLDIHDIAELTRVSTSSIYRAVKQGAFPRPTLAVTGGEKSVRWLTADYVAWVEEHRAKQLEPRVRTHRR
jgi:predicted DNA-binding transcriptional regulator AlpA